MVENFGSKYFEVSQLNTKSWKQAYKTQINAKVRNCSHRKASGYPVKTMFEE
jgi:hypothetical protein